MSQFNFNYDPNLIISNQDSIEADTSAETKKSQTDERIWTTPINDECPSYGAVVRVLPEDSSAEVQAQTGMNNFDGQHPAVRINFHKMQITKNGPILRAKCLKKDRHDRTKGVCPYCDWAWDRFYKIKDKKPELLNALQNIGQDFETARRMSKTNFAFERWFANVLIRDDKIKPELNGMVKIWEHSEAVHDLFVEARNPGFLDKKRQEKAALAAKKGYASANTIQKSNGVADLKQQAQAVAFVPEHPQWGHDFAVIAEYSDKIPEGSSKPLPSYDSSFFQKEATPIAYNPDGSMNVDLMLATLAQRVDLNAFAREGLETFEEAKKHLSDWLVGCASSGEGDNIGSMNKPVESATNYYNNVVKTAPPATPKFVANQVDANTFASGYVPKNVAPQQPAPQQFAQPAQQQFAQPVQQQFAQPAQQQFAQPVQQQFAQPAPQQFAQPVQQQFAQPAPQQFAQPAQQPAPQVQPSTDVNSGMIDDDDLPF